MLRTRASSNKRRVIIVFLLFALFAYFLFFHAPKSKLTTTLSHTASSPSPSNKAQSIPASPGSVGTKYLVVYAYHESSKEYRENLQTFIKLGVDVGSPMVDYIFVFNGPASVEIPTGSNIFKLTRSNTCFDIGAFRAGLEARGVTDQTVETTVYKYFFFINSSVRGPYVPKSFSLLASHVPNSARIPPWLLAFSSMITNQVKLAGCTINCGADNPHVQSFAWTTDTVGLKVLLSHPKALGCPKTFWDAISAGEVLMSRAIMDAGFQIDSLMIRYDGVDFRKTENHNCNDRVNPLSEQSNDGISVHPLEIMFFKVKDWYRLYAQDSRKYAEFLQHSVPVNSNHFTSPASKADRARKLAKLMDEARKCNLQFDAGFYLEKNPDLQGAFGHLPMKDAIKACSDHFVNHGFGEGRIIRFVAVPGSTPSSDDTCKQILENGRLSC